MKTLHLTLFRRWFIDILEGTKTEEYREIKPFWAKRLFQQYDTVTFRNGYAKDAPLMVVEFKGVETKAIYHPIHHKSMVVFAVKLGRILHAENCDKLVSDKQLSIAIETVS
jgi:hypothetical protein